MPDESLMDEHSGAHPAGGYERTDASVRLIIYSVVALAALLVVSQLLLVWVYNRVASAAVPEPREREIVISPQDLPPQPRLQVSPALDMEVYRQRQSQELTTYGWADPATGAVRIPIERAKQLLLEKGLPVQQNRPNLLPEPVPLDSGGFSRTVPESYISNQDIPGRYPPAAGGGPILESRSPLSLPEMNVPPGVSPGEIGAPPHPPIPEDKEGHRGPRREPNVP